MKGYVVVSPSKGKIELQEFVMGDPGPREIQVRIHTSLISPGTERAWILGMPNTPAKYPFEPGYCAAGVVEKKGKEVTRFSEGDRVACFLISHRSVGNVGEEYAVKIPDGVSFEQAVFMPLGETSLQGVRKARIELGEKAMVLGLGLIGQLALQFVRLCGALPAIGVDCVDKRLKMALDCGADQVINSNGENWVEELGIKPQVVIESTGSTSAVDTAIKSADTFGRVVLLGSTRGETTVNFYSDVHRTGISIIGAHANLSVPKFESRPGYWTWEDETVCFMKLLEKKKINIEPLITNRTKWENVTETYSEILAWNTDMLGAVINWA